MKSGTMMKNSLRVAAALVLGGFLAAPALAQVGVGANLRVERDKDTTRTELRNYDSFADRHPDIAQELRTRPSLINNEEYVEHHPELRGFLVAHPAVREEFKENPHLFE